MYVHFLFVKLELFQVSSKVYMYMYMYFGIQS